MSFCVSFTFRYLLNKTIAELLGCIIHLFELLSDVNVKPDPCAVTGVCIFIDIMNIFALLAEPLSIVLSSIDAFEQEGNGPGSCGMQPYLFPFDAIHSASGDCTSIVSGATTSSFN